ncbi:MAG: tryptophan synthase subunit alpha [Fastidiosipilaceae bacterium]|jgi:tryptophan synthase alpha chain
MSKIANAFANGKAFIAFLTAADPNLEKTEEYIEALIEGGADLIEIGVPFSDPVAEGPVIQAANVRALKNPGGLDELFELVERLRKRHRTPLVFLTYLNPVHYYGYEAFFARAEQVGLDGIIVPDMPYEEHGEVKDFAVRHNIDVISLIAPTSKARIDMIAAEARGFLYVVSSMGVTGMRDELSAELAEMMAHINRVSPIPTAIGFGIHSPGQAAEMATLADGVIVGSAIVQIIEDKGDDAAEALRSYAREMKAAISGS